MKESELNDIKNLFEQVMYAQTKKDAIPLLNKLKFLVGNVKHTLSEYASYKLEEAISFATTASGQVKEKEHWISQAQQCWYIFENSCKI